MDYLRAAARQHWQHTYVPTSKRVVEVSLPEAREQISLHLPGVWRIRLSGPGAAVFSPPSLGNKLLDLGLITSIASFHKSSYYHFENPLEKYIQFNEEKPTHLSMERNSKSASSQVIQTRQELSD